MTEYNIEELLEQINIVDYVQQFVELELFQGEWWGLCPLHKEKTPSFSINENKQIFYCQGCKIGGSVINFVSEFFKISIGEAIEKLATEFSIGTFKTASIIKIAKKWKPKNQDIQITNQLKLKNNVMDKYQKKDIQEWIDEGINQSIMNEFQVRYDPDNNRIVFPIWDNEGTIISISGRTLDPDWKKKKIRKYTYYNKIVFNNFFYGYYQNKKFIEEKDELIIFEGAKSVWKAIGYEYLNSVASVTDALSPEQIRELLKINFKNVVIAWDKGVRQDHIKKQIHMLLHFKNLYLIVDKNKLLTEKDSPVDKGKEVWDELYKSKVKM
jgi:DNA primase